MRPRVIVTATISIDGRIALSPDRILLEPTAGAVWSAFHPSGANAMIEDRTELLKRRRRPLATLNGSGSFTTGPGSPLPTSTDDPQALLTDFLPQEVVEDPQHRQWFVVADGRGRVRWHTKGGDGFDLLVLVATSTPPEYLAFLRREGICYLVVGDSRVDLQLALDRMHADLGVECVLADGGGELNGALLRGRLVDQLELVVLPLAVGGRNTPSLFDGDPLSADELPTALTLISTRVTNDGALWLSYEVGATGATSSVPPRPD